MPVKMCCSGVTTECNSIEICDDEGENNQSSQTPSTENAAENRRSSIVNDLEPIEHTDNDYDEYQIDKHIVLLVILLCSMFVVSALSHPSYRFMAYLFSGI